MNPRLRLLGVGVVIAAWALGAQAADSLPDRRAVRSPVVVSPLSNQDAAAGGRTNQMLDVYQQLDDLRNQIEQLQNQVEVQSHEIQQLKLQQRDVGGDLDRRVRALEARPVEAPPAAPVAPPAGADKVPSAQEQREYDAAFNFMKQGLYDQAIKGFRAFLAAHPSSRLADNAQYWVAEGNYVQRNYKAALDEFSRLASSYPDSQKVPDALLKIGYIQYELKSSDAARKTWQDVVRRYPNSNAAQLAQKRLDKMKKNGR
jgi:tol-pal system protein YbgF